jgi:hypothetical protein
MKFRLLVIALCWSALHASAQQSVPQAGTQPKPAPSPEETKRVMDATMASMMPIFSKMTEATIDASLQKAEDPVTAQRIARFKRNLYKALMLEGFTSAQAFSIMQSTGIPSAMPSIR